MNKFVKIYTGTLIQGGLRHLFIDFLIEQTEFSCIGTGYKKENTPTKYAPL